MRENPQGRGPRAPGWAQLAGWGGIVLLAHASAFAQMPGFPSLFPDPLKPSSTHSPAGDAGQVKPEPPERVLERLRQQIVEVKADREREAQPPPGIAADEVADLGDLRTALVGANELQIHALQQLDKTRAEREAADTLARNWTGFDGKPPYSILMVDELRDAAGAVNTRLAAMERAGEHLRSEIERLGDETKRAQETLRRAQETMDRAADPVERQQATWRRDLARLRLRSLGSRTTGTQVLQQVQIEAIAVQKSELDLLSRKIALAARDSTFSEADLAKARERMAAVAAGLRAEQQVAIGRLPAREREREEADWALAGLRERAGTSADDVKVAEARLRAADAWVAALRSENDMLEGLRTLANEQGRFWEARRVAVVGAEADDRLAAAERLRTAASRLTRWRGYLDNLVTLQRARLAEAEAVVVRADALPGALRYDQDTVAALRRSLAVSERGQDAIETALRTMDRWVADADRQRGTRGFAERVADNWSAVKSWARDVWNFELFAVEDTTLVDGREVKTSRGVTVGKSIGAFLVFLLGFLLAANVARRIERRLVDRGFDVRRVRNYRRWALSGVAFVLALFTLNVARIPLTVFAFLGGALAIGVGFGTQTIIKNFISGLILLGERRIQIGDIVEIDGVTGTVTSVDLRSSTVLGFDGVETSVPNAVFLENKVTNWTQSDRRVRRAVKVGVDYGSPLREVADILEECAKRHGVVLDDPPPQVIFEDFGADALMFALYYWLELRPGVNAAQVGSDLRFMIARRLAEAGIGISYPQRDVHLDAAQPLRIELVGAGPSRGS